VQEMRVSLIFPILCTITLRLKNLYAVAVASFMTCLTIGVESVLPSQRAPEYTQTILITAFFILGICMARSRKWLAERMAVLRGPFRFAFFIIGLWLFFFAGREFSSLTAFYIHRNCAPLAEWFTAFGGASLIAFSLNSCHASRFLCWSPIHLLGRISYSLYLLHFVVLLYGVHLLYGKVQMHWIILIVFGATIVVSVLSYFYIELPSMNLGRSLSNRLRGA